MFRQLIISLILVTFSLASINPLSNASAQSMPALPAPGTMVDFSPKFNQATLKGIIFHPENPFKFDFILDEGDVQLDEEESKAQSQKIAAYFFASLTTPQKEIWVNLSPYEKSRIVPVSFGDTLMGQNLLAQDYMLKQIMATALYPERQLGREFWQKVYTQAIEKYGTSNIPINTFNKVWIVPDKAVVYENTKMNAVFVAKSSLKVMLEKDYIASYKHKFQPNPSANIMTSVADTMSAAVIKELVIPALEKEVNEGRNFAPLRQVYNALILAKWYKDNLRNNVIARGYVDRNKIAGVDSLDKQMVSKIYNQYLKAYKKGVFNYIKEDFDEASQSLVPRKYFSGGFFGGALELTKTYDGAMTAAGFTRALIASVVLTFTGLSAIPPVSAQQSDQEQQVRQAISETKPAVSNNGILTDALTKIKDASNQKGDPLAAAMAFRQLADAKDPSAVKYAIKISRQSGPPDWDQLLNLPSNSTGGLVPSLLATNQGALEAGINFSKMVRRRANAGDSTLRLEAISYLESILADDPDQIRKSSEWDKLFHLTTWDALNTKYEINYMDKAERLLTQAAFIRAGKETRDGNAIRNLEQVEKELQSPDCVVRYAAAEVFNAIKPGTENKSQDMISKFLQQRPDKTSDIGTYDYMAAIVSSHGITTLLPSMIQDLGDFSNERPSKLVELRNWHVYLQSMMLSAIKLSKGNKYFLMGSYATSGRLTEPGSTEMVNSAYLGLLFTAVQTGDLKLQDFVNRLNKVRARYGLPNVSVNDIQIEQQDGEVSLFLAQLMDGIDVEQNVHKIVLQGGPAYFPDLLEILKKTKDERTLKAISGELNRILSMGVYSRDAWTAVINDRLVDMNRAEGIGVLRGLAAAGVTPRDQVQPVIQLVLSQKNPVLDPTEMGQTPAFYDVIALAAQVIVNSGISQSELGPLLDDSTPTEPTARNTKGLLEIAIYAARNGENPRTALDKGGKGWQYASAIVEDYLRGNGGNPEGVAAVLDVANDTFKNRFESGSGDSILKTLIDKYLGTYEDTSSGNSDYLHKLADVSSKLKDKGWGFECLGEILHSHFPETNKYVLGFFHTASDEQKTAQSTAIVGTFVHLAKDWVDKNPYANRDTLYAQGSTGYLIIQLGQGNDSFATAIQEAKENAKSDLRLYLALQGLGTGKNAGKQIPTLKHSKATKDQVIEGSAAATEITRPVGLHESGTSVTHSQGGSYLGAMVIINNSPAGSERWLDALNNLANMPESNFPTDALEDLGKQFAVVNDPQQRVQLIKTYAKALRHNGGSFYVAQNYGPIKKLISDEFQRANDEDTQNAVVDLMLSAPPEMAGQFCWGSIGFLKEKYPNLANPQQRNDFFGALKIIRDKIRNMNQHQVITDYMKKQLLYQKNDRFRMGTEYVFLGSIDPLLVKDFEGQLGISFAGEDHYLQSPKRSGALITGTDMYRMYTTLASNLTVMKLKADDFQKTKQSNDLLQVLNDLYNPSDPDGQMAAMKKLQGEAVFFEGKIPYGSDDVHTFELYLCGQYKVTTQYETESFATKQEYEAYLVSEMKQLSQRNKVLFMLQTTKRGPYATELARLYLRDDELFKISPEGINELVYLIGEWGTEDMVEPLLDFYFRHGLDSYYFLNSNYVEQTVIEAIRSMYKRDKVNVKSRLELYKSSLPDTPNYWNEKLVLKNLIYRLDSEPDKKNKAMLSVNGGIDLEDVHLQSQGAGRIKTAFDDQAQLAILMRSDGLTPVVEIVKPLTQEAIDQLLGFI